MQEPSTKTILIAHRQAAVRDRFAAALSDARHGYVVADTEASAAAAMVSTTAGPAVSLVLVDLGLAADGVAFVKSLRLAGGDVPVPVVVFAGTVASADDVRGLLALGVAGYINEHAATALILPALAPFLFPDSFDRRNSPRVAVGIPVSFRAGQTISGALTLNIGKGGIAIRTMSPLETATVVQVKFRLPGTKADIDAGGRIAWSNRKVGMGLQFERLDSVAQHLIDKFVENNS